MHAAWPSSTLPVVPTRLRPILIVARSGPFFLTPCLVAGWLRYQAVDLNLAIVLFFCMVSHASASRTSRGRNVEYHEAIWWWNWVGYVLTRCEVKMVLQLSAVMIRSVEEFRRRRYLQVQKLSLSAPRRTVFLVNSFSGRRAGEVKETEWQANSWKVKNSNGLFMYEGAISKWKKNRPRQDSKTEWSRECVHLASACDDVSVSRAPMWSYCT
jgi:hypothetical protein